tara:strand:- start:3364 stop:4587 length:1224 start_codon:yes stop_codon:yes gene_type:complete
MQSFKQYLNESRNTHLEHLEDEIVNNGYDGGVNAVNFLSSIRDMMLGSSRSKLNVSVKWDGAPAVFCGINPENGKFFVGSKSIFNVTPKINYTNSDISRNHSGGLVDRLKVCLKYLPRLGIRGVVQGDLLFVPGDIKGVTIHGEKAIAFKPNTITYAVPEGTPLASRILRAKLGIIFHTSYSGRTMDKLKASFGVNVRSFNNSSAVFFSDASYKDTSGVATFTSSESDSYDAQLRMAMGSIKKGKSVLELMKRQKNLLSVGARLKIFFNDYVKRGKSVPSAKGAYNDFRKYYASALDDEVDARKTDKAKSKYATIRNEGLRFIDRYATELYFAIASYMTLQKVKSFLVQKMNQIKSIGTFIQTDKGFRVTNPEGYVAVDRSGSAVKLVDRLEFSTANFTIAKSWIRG